MDRPGMRLAFGAAATERCDLTFGPAKKYIFKTIARFTYKCCVFLCPNLVALFSSSSLFGNLSSFFLFYKLRPAPDKRFGRCHRACCSLIKRYLIHLGGPTCSVTAMLISKMVNMHRSHLSFFLFYFFLNQVTEFIYRLPERRRGKSR